MFSIPCVLCRAYGVAAVYVSHDLAVVGQLATHVAVMYSGRIVERGVTADIFRTPFHPYTRGLLRAAPSPERSEILEGIEGQPPWPTSCPRGCFFAPRCPLGDSECRRAPVPLLALSGQERFVRCLHAEDAHTAFIPYRASAEAPVRPSPLEILTLSGVSARYGPIEVVHDVNHTGSVPASAGSCGVFSTSFRTHTRR